MSPKFQNFTNVQKAQEYFGAVSSFVNQTKEQHLRFLFDLFDVFNEEKITEAGLFKFMEDASLRRSDLPAIPTEILNLNEMENDIFLDIFTTTYSKVVEAITKKKKKMVTEIFGGNKNRNLRLGSI